MNATNKIQCIDNKQMNSHDNPLKDQAIRVTFDAGTGYGWMRNREEASQNEASGERLIAGNDLHCQAAAKGFAVLGVHIFTCFVHGFDNFIEADARLAGTAQRHTCGVHRFYCRNGVTLNAPNSSARPAAAIEHATPTSPWQPTSAPEIDAFIL